MSGEGVGAVRTVTFGPPGEEANWTEKVTAVDNDAMTWSYIVTSPLPPAFPINIDTFVCTMSVKADGEGKCEATVGCVYDSDKPDDPGLQGLGGMYGAWLDLMLAKATALPSPAPPPASGRCCVIA